MGYLFKANSMNLKYLLKKYWLLLVIETLFSIFSGLSGAVSAFFSKSFVNQIIINKNLRTAIIILVLVSLFTLLRNVFQSLVKTYSKYAFSKIQIFSRINFSEHTKKLNLSFFDIPENRNCLTRADQYASTGTEQLVTYLVSLFSNIIGCASIIYLLSAFEWWIVVFLIALMLYKMIIETVISKKNYKFKKDRVIRERRIGYFSGIFKNAPILIDLHIFDGFRLFKKLFAKHWNENLDMQTKHDVRMEILYASTYFVLLIQNVVLYIYAGNALLNGSINVGEFTLFFSVTGYLNILLLNLKNSFNSLYPMILEAKNYKEFLEIDKKYKFNLENDHLVKIKKIETIKFKNVSFSYPGKDFFVLKSVSFCVKRGETISLVGLNGSGKTTIIKLLLKLYDPTEGQILINDVPLQDISTESYWKLCSTVFQNFNIYPISAVENITFKDPQDINFKYVEEITKKVGVYERLSNEKLGINTPLSRDFDDYGTYLSGGEKQKIAFARATYKNAPLKILDEPASSLDAQAEQALFDYIEREKKENSIIFFVSHRLSTSALADQIFFIEKGTLSCSGDHAYMMNNCKSYKELYELQSSKYIR